MSVFAVLIWVALLPHDEAAKLSSLRGGECLVLTVPTVNTVINTVHKRDCSQPHNAEVYAEFSYPATPANGQPTPEENCKLPPDITPVVVANTQRILVALSQAGNTLVLLSNNPDTTQKREYACVVEFADRTGSFLTAAATAATATTG